VLFKLGIINKYIKFINENPNRFFRDHTLKVIKNYKNYTTDKGNNKNLGSYLAGLIEGDGSIYIPKDNKNASRIIIVFKSKDIPLALIIQKIFNGGNIYKKKGKNAYTYEISDIKNLIKLVNLINGNMRTPKIIQLYKLID
jgi:LAGLIDADG endonuclease